MNIDSYKERIQQSCTPFPDQQFIIQELLTEGDKVACAWKWTGTRLADMPGFPTSGKSVAISGLTIYSSVNDHIVGHWQITDRLGVYQQLTQS